jgi:FkbM family methyltransferase
MIDLARGCSRKLSIVHSDWRNVGMRETLAPRALRARYRLLELAGVRVQGKLMRYGVTGVAHPFHGRYGTTDPWAFHQVFVDREFRPLDQIKNARLILDCGANVGYASIWFLNRFPEARVVAVEPDPANFALCTNNLEPYADRASVLNYAVWSHRVGLRIHRPGDPKFDYWSLQVREATADETPDVWATTIEKLLAGSECDSIDILKIDIEGAEAAVFSCAPHEWLPKVKNLVIELHEDPCTAIFFDALSHYDYDLLRERELTFCLNLRPRDDQRPPQLDRP